MKKILLYIILFLSGIDGVHPVLGKTIKELTSSFSPQ